MWAWACGYFKASVACTVRTITAILPETVLQDALSEVTKRDSPTKLKVFEEHITAFMNGRNRELVDLAESVMKKS